MRIVMTSVVLAGAALAVAHPVPAVAGTETVLYSFTGDKAGDEPLDNPQLVMNAAGRLFGTAQNGSTTLSGNGLVFALTPPKTGQTAWTRQTLYRFGGSTSNDGAEPLNGLTQGANHALIGMTLRGGASSNCGTVYVLTPVTAGGQTVWSETVLYRFGATSTTDGCSPLNTRPMLDSSGTIFGITESGGGTGFGGVLFRLDPPAFGGTLWNETILHRFGAGTDGKGPTGALVADSGGNIYGTTNGGGTNGDGTVWEYIPPANQPPNGGYQTIYNFTGGSDGRNPFGGIVGPLSSGIVADVEFYGTAALGGPVGAACGADCGTVFSLTRQVIVGSTFGFSTLHNFTGGTDGQEPDAGLTVDAAGTLWGTTTFGGNSACADGCGTLFHLTRNSSVFGPRWNYAQAYAFKGPASNDGSGPENGVIANASGSLFGLTQLGGTSKVLSSGAGTVFEYMP